MALFFTPRVAVTRPATGWETFWLAYHRSRDKHRKGHLRGTD